MVILRNFMAAVALAAMALVAVGLVAAPQEARAQGAQGVRIGFVNVARLLAESPQANAANRALEGEFAGRQRDLVAKQEAFQQRSEKFQKDAAVMGADERRNAENDLRRDERDLQRQFEELREDVNIRRNEELGKLRVDLLREVEAFAREQGYDLIVSDALYVGQSVDVTPQVLKALQSRFEQGGG